MKSIMAIAVFLLLISLVKGQPTFRWYIKHKGTNKCIDVAGKGKGDLLQIWDCNGGTNQKFQFDGWMGDWTIRSLANSAADQNDVLCVDGDVQKGNQLGVWTCMPTPFPPQSWTRSYKQSETTCTITRNKGGVAIGDLCFDLPGGDTTNGNVIWLWDCNGTPNQEWDIVEEQSIN